MKDTVKRKSVILAVDDEPNVTAGIKRTLTGEGYQVVEVNDPRKVESYLLYTNLHLVITDMRMPERDGLEVLKVVRMSKPEIPVVILTGYGAIETAVEATRLGAAEFLSKPLDSQKLIEIVNKHANPDKLISDDTLQLLKQKSLQAPDVYELKGDKLLLKEEIIATETIPDGFVEAKFDYLIPGEPLPFSVFVQLYNKATNKYFLRRIGEKGKVMTGGIRHALYKTGLHSFYVLEEDYRSYLTFYSNIKSSPIFRHEMIKDEKQLVLYGKAVESITDLLTSKVDNTSVRASIGLVDDIFRKMVKDPDMYRDMFKMFKKDNDLFSHSSNVCLLVVSFAIHLKLDEQTIKYLGLGALYHDVGMVDIDKHILEKPGPLSSEEWFQVMEHPLIGAESLESSTIFPPLSLRIVREHHEESKGTGYPKGLKWGQISSSAVLTRIVDKFDAMTTPKPYRKAFSPVDSLKRIYVDEPLKKIHKIIAEFIKFLGGRK